MKNFKDFITESEDFELPTLETEFERERPIEETEFGEEPFHDGELETIFKRTPREEITEEKDEFADPEIHAVMRYRKGGRKIVKKLHEKLKKHYDEDHYEWHHIEAVSDYTDSSSWMNNKLLRGAVDKKQSPITSLDQAVRIRKTPEKMLVYTGISYNHREKIKDLAKNKKTPFNMLHPAFLSTSIDPKHAEDFGDGLHMIQIEIPKNTHGLYVDGVTNYGEREFILPRNSILKIHPKPSVDVPFDSEGWNDKIIWKAKLIGIKKDKR